MKNIKIGDRILYKHIGYGLISYEGPEEIIDKDDNKIYTSDFEEVGMEWDDKSQTYKYDGGLGLVTYAVPSDDPEGLNFIKECE